ncbi:uncharacterized protein C8Q71DRAFT_861855 [Rhodofomes roseus]|uniref:Uncharacterized protein n=1 Tax=Rhodofomes roseus TaxID=34475 RepID=A0ABQ8K3B8_9APHY|nr:uncharacterized protein C8Q71DRAFT_861855 [Rhodofomes roseus]KAH9831122.1 hypothetical protein C8Q71DRAFT_861855 [Rhodofomes roseus]
MPKSPTKSVTATDAMEATPRYNTRAVSRNRRLRANAKVHQLRERTPRGRRVREMTHVNGVAPATRHAKEKTRQQPTPRSAMRKHSAFTAMHKRFGFARSSHVRSQAGSNGGTTNADGEREIDKGSNYASTDADGDSTMGDNDRGEIDDNDVPDRVQWRRPAGFRRGGMLGHNVYLNPMLQHQAAPGGRWRLEDPMAGNMQANDFIFPKILGEPILDFDGPFGLGQRQALFGPAEAAMAQMLGAPIAGQSFQGMMDRSTMGAGFQPFAGAQNQQFWDMGMQPRLGIANRQLAGTHNQQQFMDPLQQLGGVRNQQLFGAGNQQVPRAVHQWNQRGIAPVVNRPVVGAGGNPAVGADNGLFLGGVMV